MSKGQREYHLLQCNKRLSVIVKLLRRREHLEEDYVRDLVEDGMEICESACRTKLRLMMAKHC